MLTQGGSSRCYRPAVLPAVGRRREDDVIISFDRFAACVGERIRNIVRGCFDSLRQYEIPEGGYGNRQKNDSDRDRDQQFDQSESKNMGSPN